MERNFKAASFPSVKFAPRHLLKWGLGCTLLLVGCTATTQLPVVQTTARQSADAEITAVAPRASQLFTGDVTDKEALIALILAERQATIEHNLSFLGQLWADDAQIIDGRNSVTPADDYRWQGRAAILDRYEVAVFPFVLPPLAALDARAVITITGEYATVQHLTDRWQMTKSAGRWWLTELSYSTRP